MERLRRFASVNTGLLLMAACAVTAGCSSPDVSSKHQQCVGFAGEKNNNNCFQQGRNLNTMNWDLQKSFAKRDEYLAEILANTRSIFSYLEDGKRVFSNECAAKVSAKSVSGTKEKFSIVYTLGKTGATVRLDFTSFRDFPYFEYETYFVNPGRKKTKVIDTFRTLEFTEDLTNTYYEKSDRFKHQARVIYYLGANSTAYDFHRREKVLLNRVNEDTLTLGGREICRSSEINMPFFRLDTDDFNGYDFAIGWSGGWQADFTLEDKKVLLSAGMPENHFALEPGETLRGPGAFIGFRSGLSEADQINVHRQFMMTHHAPRDSKGNPIIPPITAVDWGGIKTKDMLTLLDAIHQYQIPIECHWIDTAWMGYDGPCNHPRDPDYIKDFCDWGYRAGNYRINRYSHPNGLRVITDRARKYGMTTLAWFEPERYCRLNKGDMLEKHPEWFIPHPERDIQLVVDFGNDDAREWITKNVIRLMRQEGFEHYRQDFNMKTYPCWYGKNIPADRVGVQEMKHIAGLYRFWKDLRKEFPDMLIDNCAAGGRRLDYVLATDSVTLCQSDYSGIHKCSYTAEQLQNCYLNEIYPLHSPMAWLPDCDLYSSFSSACGMGINSKLWNYPSLYPKPGTDATLYRQIIIAGKEMRTAMLGNYYFLTPDAQKRTSFCALQAYNANANRGYVLVFRRPETRGTVFRSELYDIDPDAVYEVREFGKEGTQELSGKEFADFSAAMPDPRSVRLFFFRKK